MIGLIVSGVVLGLSAGVSPRPLLTLVITESLRGGWPGTRPVFGLCRVYEGVKGLL